MTRPEVCKCGSDRVITDGAGVNRRDGIVFLYQCADCGRIYADYADGVDEISADERAVIAGGTPIPRRREGVL